MTSVSSLSNNNVLIIGYYRQYNIVRKVSEKGINKKKNAKSTKKKKNNIKGIKRKWLRQINISD